MGIRLVRGRALGGSLAAFGALALSASIFWPTTRTTQKGVAFEEGGPGQDMVSVTWSWGKWALEEAPEGMHPPDVSNTLGLVVLVVVVLVGAAGSAAWLLVAGVHGRLFGVAGTALVAASAAQTVLQRLGQSLMISDSDENYVQATTVAGRFEQLAVALLFLALLVMLWRSLLGVGRPLWALASARVAAARAVEEPVPAPAESEGWGAVIVHGERADGDHAVPHDAPGAERATPVGFTDLSSDDDRFSPPAQAEGGRLE